MTECVSATENIFAEFEIQFDDVKQRNILVSWLDQTPPHRRSDNSLRDFIQEIVWEEKERLEREEEPTVNFTAGQINERGAFREFCEWSGINEWAMNEGQMNRNERFEIPYSLAKQWGLIK